MVALKNENIQTKNMLICRFTMELLKLEYKLKELPMYQYGHRSMYYYETCNIVHKQTFNCQSSISNLGYSKAVNNEIN